MQFPVGDATVILQLFPTRSMNVVLDDILAQGGYMGWKRVEAFRSLLRSTKRKLAGNRVRPKPPPTGTGILECLALVQAPLPALSSLKEKPLAEKDTG